MDGLACLVDEAETQRKSQSSQSSAGSKRKRQRNSNNHGDDASSTSETDDGCKSSPQANFQRLQKKQHATDNDIGSPSAGRVTSTAAEPEKVAEPSTQGSVFDPKSSCLNDLPCWHVLSNVVDPQDRIDRPKVKDLRSFVSKTCKSSASNSKLEELMSMFTDSESEGGIKHRFLTGQQAEFLLEHHDALNNAIPTFTRHPVEVIRAPRCNTLYYIKTQDGLRDQCLLFTTASTESLPGWHWKKFNGQEYNPVGTFIRYSQSRFHQRPPKRARHLKGSTSGGLVGLPDNFDMDQITDFGQRESSQHGRLLLHMRIYALTDKGPHKQVAQSGHVLVQILCINCAPPRNTPTASKAASNRRTNTVGDSTHPIGANGVQNLNVTGMPGLNGLHAMDPRILLPQSPNVFNSGTSFSNLPAMYASHPFFLQMQGASGTANNPFVQVPGQNMHHGVPVGGNQGMQILNTGSSYLPGSPFTQAVSSSESSLHQQPSSELPSSTIQSQSSTIPKPGDGKEPSQHDTLAKQPKFGDTDEGKESKPEGFGPNTASKSSLKAKLGELSRLKVHVPAKGQASQIAGTGSAINGGQQSAQTTSGVGFPFLATPSLGPMFGTPQILQALGTPNTNLAGQSGQSASPMVLYNGVPSPGIPQQMSAFTQPHLARQSAQSQGLQTTSQQIPASLPSPGMVYWAPGQYSPGLLRTPGLPFTPTLQTPAGIPSPGVTTSAPP